MKKTYLNLYLPLFKGKRKYLAYYVCGLVDGEGSFSVSFKKHPTLKSGWLVDPVFQVYQHKNGIEVPYLIKGFFGTGSVYRKSGSHPVMVYGVHSRRSLQEKIVPFFKKHPLILKKRSFEIFVEILERMERKEHLTKEGIRGIYRLAARMNLQGKGRKYSLKDFS